MQEHETDIYSLRITCEDITILIPLSSVHMILASDDVELHHEYHRLVSYKERTYPIFSLSELLQKKKQEERYVILIQNEDIEAALYVTQVNEVIKLNQIMMELPSYLHNQRMSYMTGCCLLPDHVLAYRIDILKLMQRSNFKQEEAYEN